MLVWLPSLLWLPDWFSDVDGLKGRHGEFFLTQKKNALRRPHHKRWRIFLKVHKAWGSFLEKGSRMVGEAHRGLGAFWRMQGDHLAEFELSSSFFCSLLRLLIQRTCSG